MRLKARVDRNQKEIVEALRKAGACVLHLHQLGKGVPDLLVYRGGYFLLEIKDGSKPSSSQKLTPAEKKWIRGWHGPIQVVRSPEEALKAVRAIGEVEI